MNTELSIAEKDRFGQLERIVSAGLSTFYNVGSALREISTKKLYRQKHGTFEEYCRSRWNIGKAYAYRLIVASEVAENLSTIGDITREPITKESQLRPLSALKPKQQKKAWNMAKKAKAVPTAKDVEAAVEQVSGRVTPKQSSTLTRASSFEAAFKLMRLQGQGELELDFGEFGVTIIAKGNN